MKTIGGVALLVGMMLSACGGESTITVEMAADSASQGSPGALTIGDDLEIDRLEVQLREIKILPDNANEGAEKFKAKGEFLLDVLDAERSALPETTLEPGLYKKVEFKIEKPSSGEGLDGTDAPLVCEGRKGGIAFALHIEDLSKITLRDVNGINLQEGDAEGFVVDLVSSSWFEGVDLAELEAEEDGVVLIDKDGPNKDAHKTIRDNIQAAIKLLRKP